MNGSRPRLDDLHVYGWETASLTPERLNEIETEAGSLLGCLVSIPIVTCQRYELVAISADHRSIAPHGYEGVHALLHISRLAAGLESLVLGEAEVLGQVRKAFSATSPEVRDLIAPAIAAARSLRAEASFDRQAGHTLDAALEHVAMKPAGSLLVVGGGPMGRRVAERAYELGFQTTLVARRPPPIPEGITYRPFSALSQLPATDVLVACLGRAAPQMGVSDVPAVRVHAIDLGTPRNLKDDFDFPVLTLADLIAGQAESRTEANLRSKLDARLQELLKARLVTDVPNSPLGLLREEVELIRQRELTRTLRLHPELPPEKLDTITRTLVNQIFHRPSRKLRQSGDRQLAAALADLFIQDSQETDDGN